jgi:DNA-binding response OmpR family regulator
VQKRLLLIEHDVTVAAGIRRALREDEFIIDRVRDGPAAERALQFASYSVVVLDLGLPRKQCLAILDDLYARSHPIPMVVIDAQQSESDPDALAARIRAAVRRKTQRRKHEDRPFALPFSWR